MSWIEEEISFYDFLWEVGMKLCPHHGNNVLLQAFRNGDGDVVFEEVKAKILEAFPSRKEAMVAFKKTNQ